jgi:hypothetical protein
MQSLPWIVGALAVFGLLVGLGSLFSGISAWALAIILVAGLGAGVVFENVERYMPGGAKNPYTADTVEKSNIGRKLFVWAGAILAATAIWALAICVNRYVN